MASPTRATSPQDLAEQYADRWVIYRDLSRDCTHDVWVAEPRHPADGTGEKITADDLGSLAEQLRFEELAAQYAGRFTIYQGARPNNGYVTWVAAPCADGPRIFALDIETLACRLQHVVGA
jgi:hypothetical protein